MITAILFHLLIVAIPSLALEVSPHALYLAVVQIDHSDRQSDAAVLIKVFTNDLQDVIRAASPDAFKPVETTRFCQANHDAIESYFQGRLNCRINGRSVQLTFQEGTQENDVFWLKFRMDTPDVWKEISIQASFFMEIFSTQSNIIQVMHASEKRFARLTKEEQQTVFQFGE